MTFAEIIPDILNDKAIRRKCWEEKECIFINGVGSITNRIKEGYLLDYVIDDTDLKANDWEVYDDREYFDFWKAFELMKEGKRVRRNDCHIEGYYIYLEDGIFYDNAGHSCGMHEGNLEAKDWYLVEEE